MELSVAASPSPSSSSSPAVTTSGQPRTPMSERQQLAMIKQLEKEGAASTSAGNPESGATDLNTSSSSLTSPNRPPLVAVCDNIVRGGHRPNGNAGGAGGSMSSSATSSPGAQVSVSASPSPSSGLSPRSTTVERLRKKLLRKNDKGETYLHRAAIKGSRRIAQKLLGIGIKVDDVDNAGYTALHEACNRGHTSVARLLVNSGAEVNVFGGTHDQKETPLHDAARNGHYQVVKFLVKKGADVLAKNCHSRTPLEEARKSLTKNTGIADVVAFLARHQENIGHSDHDNGADLEEEDEEATDEVDVFKFLGVNHNKATEEALRLLDILESNSRQSSSSVGHKSGTITPSQGGGKQLRTKERSSSHHAAARRARRESDSKKSLNFTDMTNETTTTTNSSSSSSVAAVTTAITTTATTTTQATTSTTASATITTSSSQHGTAAQATSSSNNPDTATKTQTASVARKGDDVYEFKSKDSAPAPSSSPTEDTKAAKDCKDSTTGAAAASTSERGEKRPHSPDEDADGKRKKDNASPATSAVASAAAGAKGIRGTRGNSIDRSSSAKSTSGAKKGAVSGSDPSSRSNSAANSPRRVTDDAPAEGSAEQSGDAPKVPPLKISLTGNGNGGNSAQDKKDELGASPKPDVDESGADKGVSGDSSDGKSSTGSGTAASGSRVTRSRANQGTPEATSNESAEPQNVGESGAAPNPSALGAASSTSSSSGQPSNNANNSSNSNDKNYEYQVKKRKLRSQVEDSSASPASAAPSSSSAAAGASGLSAGGPGNGNGGGSSNGTGASGALSSTAASAVNLSTGISSSSTSAAAAAASAAVGGRPSWREGEPTTDIEKFLKLRDQIKQRWRNIFPVQPKPPQGYKDYLMNKKTYLLEGNKHERLRAIPRIQPPPSLEGPLRQLFMEQEDQRFDLRKRHLIQKEKLVLSVEQEILRVHGRAARALANQSLPFSFCTYIRDAEIYTPIDMQQEEKNRDIRSRYNGRLFLSWLQDVDDKWEKIKEQMVLRHHNEAESLNAVQKMDWEWRLQELGKSKNAGNAGQVDDLYIPMVNVSDEFDVGESSRR